MPTLAGMTWSELASRPVVLVPVGATEQHGPHLPLSTDTDIALALAERAALARPSCVVAPPVAYGSSGEHQGFPGTLSIGLEATRMVLVELVRSASSFATATVLVSTHGGNRAALDEVCRTLGNEGHRFAIFTPTWRGDAHAGRLETSLMLAISPGRVRRSLAQPGNTTALAELLPRLRAEGVRAASPSGVLGDPTGASGGEGEELLATALDELLLVVDEFAQRKEPTCPELP